MSEASEVREPLVKVIVPCFRYAGYLADCVDSILRQDGVGVRVLIIDDCSPDDTPAVARGLVQEDDRVEYRRHGQNTGLIATANEGLEWAADGDYVVVLSADDMLVPGSLRRATSVMEANPRVGLVYGRAMQFESDHPQPWTSHRWQGTRVWFGGVWIRLPLPRAGRWRGTRIWPGEDWIHLRCRSGHGCISSPEAVVRTSVQRQAGAYDPAPHHASEVNMWLRIAAISDIAYVKGAAQALYRIHPDSMHRTMLGSDAGPIVDLSDRRAAFDVFFATAGSELRDAARLRAMVARALARQALWQASRAYDRGQVDDSGEIPAQDLIDFALETYPETRRLREWRGLQLRQRIGAGRTLWFPPFLATGAAHRLRARFDLLRLHARGI